MNQKLSILFLTFLLGSGCMVHCASKSPNLANKENMLIRYSPLQIRSPQPKHTFRPIRPVDTVPSTLNHFRRIKQNNSTPLEQTSPLSAPRVVPAPRRGRERSGAIDLTALEADDAVCLMICNNPRQNPTDRLIPAQQVDNKSTFDSLDEEYLTQSSSDLDRELSNFIFQRRQEQQ